MSATNPPKTSRSSIAQEFLFVNKGKDSRHLSQSEKRETTLILSHVRNKTHKRSAVGISWKQHTNIFEVSTDEAEPTRECISRSLTRSRKFQLVPRCADPFCPEHGVEPRSGQPCISFPLFLEGLPSYNSSDPFHCTVGGVGVTAALHLYGKQLRSKHARLTFGAECLEPLTRLEKTSSTRHDVARAQRLRACVDDELVLYSSIAHGYASVAWPNGQIGAAHAQFWINKTMEALRVRLPAGIVQNRQGITMCIFTLTLTSLWNSVPQLWLDEPHEFCPEHFEATRIHIQAMLRVVGCTGGLHNFDPYLLEGIILADKYAAIYGLQQPLIPLIFDPGRYAVDLAIKSVVGDVTDFDDLEVLPNLHLEPELAGILQDIDHLYHSTRMLWRTGKPITADTEHMLYRRFQAQHYRLLLLGTSDAASQLVRITALVVLCSMPQYAAAPLFAYITLGHLRKRMTELSVKVERIEEGVLMWCLVVASTTKVAAKDKAWFVRRLLHRMVRNGVCVEADAVCQAMKGHINLPWINSAELQKVIEESDVP